jgi:serine protease Do
MKFARVTALILTGWAAALLSVGVACAETIQLRDGMSVTGRILAEKKDQIVVDLGFTVLAVPRGDVVKVVKEAVVPEEQPYLP